MNRTRSARFRLLVELFGRDRDYRHLDGSLLPAVQAAGESARRTAVHEQSQADDPGWPDARTGAANLSDQRLGLDVVGTPDRGYNRNQPGGWHFNILPFMEQETVHNAGLSQ